MCKRAPNLVQSKSGTTNILLYNWETTISQVPWSSYVRPPCLQPLDSVSISDKLLILYWERERECERDSTACNLHNLSTALDWSVMRWVLAVATVLNSNCFEGYGTEGLPWQRASVQRQGEMLSPDFCDLIQSFQVSCYHSL